LQLPQNYFRNRTDIKYKSNENAEVELTFIVNKVEFIVKRNLYNPRIISAKKKINNRLVDIKGSIISQENYESLDDNEKIKYLQYNYEKEVTQAGNYSDFDTLIFFANHILLFGEDRETIFWDELNRGYDLQTDLLSNYFLEPSLNLKKREYQNKAKYHDSLSRRRSEDMAPLKKLLKELNSENDSDKLIREKQEKLEKLEMKNENVNYRRLEIIEILKSLKSKLQREKKRINDLDNKLNKAKENIYSELWIKPHPEYKLFLQVIRENSQCPLCNNHLRSNDSEEILKADKKCILCSHSLFEKSKNNTKIDKLTNDLNNSLFARKNIQLEIDDYEVKIEKLDDDFSKNKVRIFEMKMELRDSDNKEDDPDITIQAIKNKISKLKLQMKKEQKKSKEFISKVKNIEEKMEENLVDITVNLSRKFDNYASSFLDLKCHLAYESTPDNPKDNRFIPIIDNSPRYSRDELSESQSFFIEQAFRMSILDYFYENPSFYICETPDSSLDISYERNAAEIYMKYLSKPNVLILTCNYNYSEFLNHIIDGSNNFKINYIDLLQIGKKSTIQNSSSLLHDISNKIKERIDEKRRL
jgi:hypothetical protein